jgi:hypothetical protein
MYDCSVPVLIRCQDSSARRSQLSHFGHWDAAIAHLLPGKWHPAADGTHDGYGKRVPMEMGPIGERGGLGPRTAVIVFAPCRRMDRCESAPKWAPFSSPGKHLRDRSVRSGGGSRTQNALLQADGMSVWCQQETSAFLPEHPLNASRPFNCPNFAATDNCIPFRNPAP